MHDYLKDFNKVKLGKNVTLLPKDADITKELMKAKILMSK